MERRRVVWMMCGLMLIAYVARANAAGVYTNATGDKNWNTPANWDDGEVPLADEDGFIRSFPEAWGYCEAVVAQDTTAMQVFVGAWNEGGTDDWGILTVTNNATFTNAYATQIGNGTPDAHGRVIVEDGGLLETHGVTGLGEQAKGELIISDGGAFRNVDWEVHMGDRGKVQLNGGVLYAHNQLTMVDGAIVDIAGGALQACGDRTQYSIWFGYIDSGWITANGQTGIENFNVVYDPVADITSFTAVPEPTTMLILLMGSAFIARRKS